tara:strand:+ start:97 stop:399 length:303 start_codon:yes stop_codon:yes gene_type:complete
LFAYGRPYARPPGKRTNRSLVDTQIQIVIGLMTFLEQERTMSKREILRELLDESKEMSTGSKILGLLAITLTLVAVVIGTLYAMEQWWSWLGLSTTMMVR